METAAVKGRDTQVNIALGGLRNEMEKLRVTLSEIEEKSLPALESRLERVANLGQIAEATGEARGRNEMAKEPQSPPVPLAADLEALRVDLVIYTQQAQRIIDRHSYIVSRIEL